MTDRHGSPTFYKLLEEMAEIHDRKSHDYASNDNPYGNYHFAGMLSKLFNDSRDCGFVGRIGEKLYRLANLENNNKIPKNETLDETERDIVTIVALWMAERRNRRLMEKSKEWIRPDEARSYSPGQIIPADRQIIPADKEDLCVHCGRPKW